MWLFLMPTMAKGASIRRTKWPLSGTALLLVFASTLGMRGFLIDSAAFAFNLNCKRRGAFVAGVLANTNIEACILESSIKHLAQHFVSHFFSVRRVFRREPKKLGNIFWGRK